ncbi:MAG: hypothetical protein LQ339_005686 [Xanthoria mediterranea]|nr:MAG: hypothetical protein LQ339_005686 [Xanthoria mediterranea]
MSASVNSPFTSPRGLLTVTKSFFDNPTVSSTDKAMYAADIIFTLLCLLLDIGMLVFVHYKMYLFFRRRRAGVLHGVGEIAGQDEKGLLMNADEKEGGERPPAYHDNVSEEHNKENVLPTISTDNRHTASEGDDNNEETNKASSFNAQVISPTSKAAHLSPHKDCTACTKLAKQNRITSTDLNGVTESVTFPLTWDDMREHTALIKWFMEAHNIEEFINTPAYAFHHDENNGNPKIPPSPTSKAAHLSPHEKCEYCMALARPDRLVDARRDGVENSVTFPLTMDDMLEHWDLIHMYLCSNAFMQSEMSSPPVHFD